MTCKLSDSAGIEFPDATVQGSAGESGISPALSVLAWCVFEGRTPQSALHAKFNISRVERLGTGHYRAYLEVPALTNDLVALVSISVTGPASSARIVDCTNEYVEVRTFASFSSSSDSSQVGVLVFGAVS